MELEQSVPRMSFRVVLAATADVTGTPLAVLRSRARVGGPVLVERVCAKVAALRLGVPAAVIRRHAAVCRWAPSQIEALCEAHAGLIKRIEERAREIAADPDAVRAVFASEAPAAPDMDAVLAAAALVTKSARRDIVQRHAAAPWSLYHRATVAAALRLGVAPTAIASALGRSRSAIYGRPGRIAAIAREHGELVDRIAAAAVKLASLPPTERAPRALTWVPPARGSRVHYTGAAA